MKLNRKLQATELVRGIIPFQTQP